MKVYMISMMNAFILLGLGLWGYLGTASQSPVELIPVFIGALLMSFVQKLRYGSKSYTRISLILTSLILVALVKPLTDAVVLTDSTAMIRVCVMMVSCAITLGFLVRKLVKVRKGRVKINN